MAKLLTAKQFIDKSALLHKDKYDYDKVVYIKSSKPVIITCRIHGDFHQKPNNHISGQGCPSCGLPRVKITTEQFIIDCQKKWNDIYDYSKTIYHNTKVKIDRKSVV